MSTAITQPSITPEISPKLKNILFTTDLSPSSELALPYARALARLYGATVHILHVVSPVPVIGPQGESYSDVESDSALAQEAIDRLIQSGAVKDVLYTTTIEIGVLSDAVAKAIAELKIDLIVLGTHGRGMLKHLLLGSTAEKIFRSADCPVLTVGPRARDRVREAKLDTIVYATDFSPASRAALPFAMSFARANGSKLILVHTVHDIARGEGVIVVPAEDLAENARAELANFVPDDAGINHEIITKYGPAAEGILKVAEETDADMIIMGAHRGTSSHAPWAVAHQVVCHATAPVLTVRG